MNVTDPSIRIFPTGLETANEDGSRKVAFKAVVENLGEYDHADDMFSTNCGKWVTQSAVKYGARALDTFGELASSLHPLFTPAASCWFPGTLKGAERHLNACFCGILKKPGVLTLNYSVRNRRERQRGQC